MNAATIAQLNAINRRFYDERADEFNQTRERAWRGWNELFERHGARVPPSPKVLDVGCGNGRFARFLRQRGDNPFSYYGIDSSPLGIEHARKRIGALPGIHLVEHDFVVADEPLPPALNDESFDLIVVFGVLHHVPGRERRQQLLTALAQRLAPGGTLAYTVWRFDQFERFKRKLVSWDDCLSTRPEIDREQLEPGDHIMTWGATEPAFRYCHAMSDEEAQELERGLPLTALQSFLGDEELNRYYVLINVEKSEPEPETGTGTGTGTGTNAET